MADLPTEPLPDHHASVIDLGEFRIRSGRTPWKSEKDRCEHKRLTIVHSERRVNCDDCGKDVDAFEVVLTWHRNWYRLLAKSKAEQDQAREALSSTLIRRASKEIDRSWGRKMAPCCPHCRGALLPEDFERDVRSSFNADMERARRRKLTSPTTEGGGK